MRRGGTHVLILLMFPIISYSQTKIQNLFFNSTTNITRLNFTNPDVAPQTYYTNIGSGASIGEGIAHIEDRSGNIVIWVNASGVYDKDGILMPGSSGILAHPSCTEIVVCPVPGDSLKYYVIYNKQLCSQLYYSIVDMKLRNGKGDVVAMNTLIDASNTFAEGLEIVKIPCTDSYWLLAYQCYSGIKRFKIDEAGITAGTLIYSLNTNNHGGRGELDYHKGRLGYGITFRNKAFVCNFSPVTGEVDSGKEISVGMTNGVYGLEFSPDASKVYFTDLDNKNFLGNVSSPNLFRYDFSTGLTDSWTINNSGASCGSLEVQGLGQIEIGKNQKLYIPHVGGCQITVVENPNELIPQLKLINVNSILSTGVSDHIQSDFLDEELSLDPKIHYDPKLNICQGENVRLAVTKNSNNIYQWYKNGGLISDETKNEIGVKEAGKYKVKLKNQFGCEAYSNEVEVKVSNTPKIELGEDIYSCAGERVILNPKKESATLLWSDGSKEPILEVTDNGKYWVKAVSEEGCEMYDSISVFFQESSEITVPNVFTPNGDNLNEYFVIENHIDELQLSVYNRWGGLAFKSENYQNDWNGDTLPSGVYFYIIGMKTKCFNEIKGWIQILR